MNANITTTDTRQAYQDGRSDARDYARHSNEHERDITRRDTERRQADWLNAHGMTAVWWYYQGWLDILAAWVEGQGA